MDIEIILALLSTAIAGIAIHFSYMATRKRTQIEALTQQADFYKKLYDEERYKIQIMERDHVTDIMTRVDDVVSLKCEIKRLEQIIEDMEVE